MYIEKRAYNCWLTTPVMSNHDEDAVIHILLPDAPAVSEGSRSAHHLTCPKLHTADRLRMHISQRQPSTWINSRNLVISLPFGFDPRHQKLLPGNSGY